MTLLIFLKIESLLVKRLQVDKMIVVPRIEDFIFYQERYPDLVTGGWKIVGRYPNIQYSRLVTF
jgi:hypothetical protein